MQKVKITGNIRSNKMALAIFTQECVIYKIAYQFKVQMEYKSIIIIERAKNVSVDFRSLLLTKY